MKALLAKLRTWWRNRITIRERLRLRKQHKQQQPLTAEEAELIAFMEMFQKQFFPA